jgi:hypothetical protein
MTAGILQVPYSTPALLATGAVAAASTLSVYNTGTLTLANLYANVGLSTPITNPLTANSAGRFTVESTLIWASDAQAYDVLLTFSDGSSLTFDNIFVIEAAGSLSGYAPLDSPHFTGVPTAPTPASNDNSNKIATTAYVQSQNYAPLASPGFSGVPTAPTATGTTNTTQIATTAFVQSLVGTGGTFTPTSGSVTFSNGFIIKSGQSLQSMTNPTTKAVTFGTAFPNACFHASANVYNPSVTNSTVTAASVVGVSTTAVTFLFNGYQSGSYNSVPGFYWMAMGY